MTLDVRTIALSALVTNLACVLVMVALWRQNRARLDGTGHWVADFALQATALVLITLRGLIPDVLSMGFTALLVASGALLGFVGMERFLGLRRSHRVNWVLVAAFSAIHGVFAFVQPDQVARNANLSVAILVIALQNAWLLLTRAPPALRRSARGVAAVLLAYAAISVVRIAAYVDGPHAGVDYLHSGTFEALVLVGYQVLFLLLAISLILLVNARLEHERVQYESIARTQQKLESIGTLASGVAHEINNPLNVVLNFADLILDEPDTSPAVRQYASTIVGESERMATIVRNLLAFSRTDAEAPSPTDLPSLVAATLSLVRSSFLKDGVLLEVSLPSGLPRVRCRGQQIQQVLMNLLTNARDAVTALPASAPKPAAIRVGAEPFQQDGEPWVRLTVEDSGVGVAPSIAGRLFDPFFTTKGRDKGTGLGLSVSYGIVKDHGGRLWFESEPGVGSRFHVDLRVDNSRVAAPDPSADAGG